MYLITKSYHYFNKTLEKIKIIIILSYYHLIKHMKQPTKMTLELHSEDEIVATETLTTHEAKRLYGYITEIQDNWKVNLANRLNIKWEFRSVLLYH